MENNGSFEHGSFLKPYKNKINIADINPYVRYVAQANFTPLTKRVCAYDHRMFYILDGAVRLTVCDRDYYLYSDSLAVIRPGDEYLFDVIGDYKLVDINFDYTQESSDISEGVQPSFAEEYNINRSFGRPEIVDSPSLCKSCVLRDADRLREGFLDIVSEFELKKIFYREKSSAVLKSIICDIAGSNSVGKGVGDARLDELLSYIKNNCAKELSNTQIAARIGYHPYYVNRLVKRYTGTTLRQYIINCRAENAKKLLIETDKTIVEISAECGFKNLTHFSDSFKAKAGVSPAVYRRNFKKVF